MNTTRKTPNSQGKGLTPILDNLIQTRSPYKTEAKHIDQISHELFTSLFILHSELRFKPVIGRTYCLYRKNERYRLSMIKPEQWSRTCSGIFIGHCKLLPDLTWSLEISSEAMNNSDIIKEISDRKKDFSKKIEQIDLLEEILPFYEPGLAYYSRIYAAGMAYSLNQSMKLANINHLNFQQALKQIENK